ncbi:hypothetical protein [Vibrio splendidus]|uniref:hypothetical protein n=1 Tax=Vibrio splendidus TaxID=29497 RepID=UPI0016A271C2|nr:hypothetical protein [Vibrio splendidus]NOJ07210.1 hypothetical protein [Vibrio splendidus]
MNKRMLHKRLVSLLCTTTVLLSTHALASQGDASQAMQVKVILHKIIQTKLSSANTHLHKLKP